MDRHYLAQEKFDEFIAGFDEVNRMLYGMIDKPEKFSLKRDVHRGDK
jgi:hypothetical protein